MRYTTYDMTPKGLKWEVKSVPAAPETWDLAKKNCSSYGNPDYHWGAYNNFITLRKSGAAPTRIA